jgi:hypothetical protein
MSSMLGKWLDRLKLALAPGTFPVGLELGVVQACPLGDERSRAPRQRTGDYVPIQIDRRRLPGVTRVEMRAGVVGFVPVHEDRDAVEEADPGHAVTVRARPEGSGTSRRLPSATHSRAEGTPRQNRRCGPAFGEFH